MMTLVDGWLLFLAFAAVILPAIQKRTKAQ